MLGSCLCPYLTVPLVVSPHVLRVSGHLYSDDRRGRKSSQIDLKSVVKLLLCLTHLVCHGWFGQGPRENRFLAECIVGEGGADWRLVGLCVRRG